jgi:hypothetical protein
MRKQERDSLFQQNRKQPNPFSNPGQNKQLHQKYSYLLSDPDCDKLIKYIEECELNTYTLEHLPEMLQKIQSPNRFEKHWALIGVRKLLSLIDTPIQNIIDNGFCPILIQFIQD